MSGAGREPGDRAEASPRGPAPMGLYAHTWPTFGRSAGLPDATPPLEEGGRLRKCRTRGRRSLRGRPSWQVAHPMRSGRGPNKTKTCSARAGAARDPRSVRNPLGEAGSRAADGATRPLAPRLRIRRASRRHSVRREAARDGGVIETGRRSRRTGQLDRPNGSRDAREVGRVQDAFVSQELGPGAVRRLGEVVDRAFICAMPTRGILGRRFPQERETRIGVTKDDQVAPPTPARLAASRRTRSTSGEAGSHSAPST
jgi:hypothetical protein